MDNSTRIRLLALDVDGTLLNGAQEISEATRAAIQTTISSGVVVVLASARSPYALRQILMTLNLDGYVVAFSGGMICRLNGGTSIATDGFTERRIPIATAHKIVRQALVRGISVGWFVGENWYIQRWDDVLRREAAIIGQPLMAALPMTSITDAPHKIQCMVAQSTQVFQLQILRDELPEDCVGQFTHETYLEIFPAGADKAAGLQQIGRQLGIGMDEIAAIGDGENDISMLQAAGLGIAMGHAPDSVKSAAQWITQSNNEDGVAQAINRMRLEGCI
jgi:Cof subfamily protein (haloacid dehalogenase superfamily)